MAHCWDEESGLFSNVQLLPGAQLGGLYLRKAPTLFYPMLSGTATVAQVERMVTQHLMNATEFCVGQAAATPATCTYALPSIAHNDPAYGPHRPVTHLSPSLHKTLPVIHTHTHTPTGSQTTTTGVAEFGAP